MTIIYLLVLIFVKCLSYLSFVGQKIEEIESMKQQLKLKEIQINIKTLLNIIQSSVFRQRDKQRKMIYTPKKNIEAFIETKNEQIKSLKQKILGSRVTYDDMQTAKSRLTNIKSAQLQLQRQDHLQLKEVLKTTQQVVNDLIRKKNILLEQLQSCQKQTQDQNGYQYQLGTKKQKVDQILKDVLEIKDKLLDRKQKKNIQIAQLQEQILIRRKQLTMERQIGDQLEIARGQLKSKVVKINKDLIDVMDDNKRLKQSIRKQLQDISKLQHQQQNDQLRIQNLQLKIQKQQKNAQNLQHKIDAAQIFMQRFSQDKLIYLKQTQTAFNIDSLLKMCTQSNQKKQKQQKQCQQDIDQLHKKIQTALIKRQLLVNQVSIKQQNLRELKQKGAQLKSILNSIFHQDSSVLKLLADKKVYQSQDVTKKTVQPQTQAQTKQDMLDMIATSQNFFMTTSN